MDGEPGLIGRGRGQRAAVQRHQAKLAEQLSRLSGRATGTGAYRPDDDRGRDWP
jgi:hypothetical protein